MGKENGPEMRWVPLPIRVTPLWRGIFIQFGKVPLASLAPVLFKCSRRAPGYFTLISEKAPPATRDSSEFARA